jgi:hypothetical protein
MAQVSLKMPHSSIKADNPSGWKRSHVTYKRQARGILWIRQATMTGSWVNSLFANPHSTYLSLLKTSGKTVFSQMNHRCAISTALRMQDSAWISRLMELGADLNVSNAIHTKNREVLSYQPIHYALKTNVAFARKLVESGNVLVSDWDFDQVFRYRVKQHKFAHGLSKEITEAHLLHVTRFLLDAGANFISGIPSLLEIVSCGPPEVVKLILPRSLFFRSNEHLKTLCLFVAISYSQWETSRLLCSDLGANWISTASTEISWSSHPTKHRWFEPETKDLSYTVPINAIEFAAYSGKLKELNKSLNTTFAPPAVLPSSPKWKLKGPEIEAPRASTQDTTIPETRVTSRFKKWLRN